MSAPVLMLQGTGSGVGKSLLTAAFCRLARRRGIAVAPFKGQNMSNNAAVTAEGGEIGRAQALQARAAGLDPHVDMNPVLLKPLADTRSEVVRLGRTDRGATDLPWRGAQAPSLARRDRGARPPPRPRGTRDRRGRGQPGRDEPAREPTSSTWPWPATPRRTSCSSPTSTAAAPSPPSTAPGRCSPRPDRALFRGFILNRFRGDPALLAPAPETLRERTGVPVLGVVPWLDHNLPEEDGGPALDAGPADAPAIAAAAYPRASNLDDLDPLRREPGVRQRWVRRARDLAALTAPPGLAAIILPGCAEHPSTTSAG